MDRNKAKNKIKIALYKGIYYIDVAEERAGIIKEGEDLCATCHLYKECRAPSNKNILCGDLFKECFPHSLRRYPIGILLQELKEK